MFSKEVDYGLLLVTSLALQRRASKDKGGFVSLKDVAKQNKIPYKFLSQIATKLKRAGVVKSKEGVSGGYKLAKKARDISVGEVVEALDGKWASMPCAEGEKCEREECCLHKDMMLALSLVVEKEMNRTTVADLLQSSDRPACRQGREFR